MTGDPYTIRVARDADVEALVRFIDEHWRKDHVFVTSRALLDWQHRDAAHGLYNFILGVEKASGAIHGILGFIPLNQFDPEIPRPRLSWMAIWKTQEAARGQQLGRRLLTFMEEVLQPDILSTVAATAMSLPLYQARGYTTGRLSHHYVLNPDTKAFRLAGVDEVARYPRPEKVAVRARRLERLDEAAVLAEAWMCFLAQREHPRKTPTYVVNRYLRHPVYRYEVFAIRDGRKVAGLVVTRVCRQDGARAVRIVDFIGPSHALRGLQAEWDRLLREADAEYLDFYNVGVEEEHLEASGFRRRTEGDGLVLPSYFEPFVQRNVEIDYMMKIREGEPYRIVKGDSDQDRPNGVPGVSA